MEFFKKILNRLGPDIKVRTRNRVLSGVEVAERLTIQLAVRWITSWARLQGTIVKSIFVLFVVAWMNSHPVIRVPSRMSGFLMVSDLR